VRALLHDATVVEHDDLIRRRRQRQPMGDADARAARSELRQRVEDLTFGAHVERAGRLVQDQHLWIAKDCPREREPLTLATTHADAPLAEEGVEAVRQPVNVSIEPGGNGRGAHLRIGGIRSAQGNVVSHAGIEDEGVLEDQAKLSTQR
jgi:hypothetical protein